MRPATKPPAPPSTTTSLEDEPRQIAILGEIADVVLNVGGVDRDGGAGGLIRGGEAHLLEQALQDRVQTPGADILDRTVDLLGKAGDLLDRLGAGGCGACPAGRLRPEGAAHYGGAEHRHLRRL